MENSVLQECEPLSCIEDNKSLGNTVLEETEAEILVARIRLNIQHPNHKEVIIVVEGEDDEKALKKFFNMQAVEFTCATSCSIVKDAMIIVSTDKQLKDCVIGIKDADFDHIKKISHNISNLMVTDTHDIETMMLTPRVCRRICLETINREYQNLSSQAMSSLKNLSYLRYYNDKMILNGGNPDKKGINFRGVIIADVASVSVRDVLQHVKAKGNSNKTSFPDLNAMNLFINQNPINNKDLALFTNGHDLVHAIQYILHSQNQAARAYSDKNIATMIRMSYCKNEFRNTKLYQDIDNWNNNRFNLWAV
ncbi:hypothetical protein [Prevotella histicola]